MTTCNRTSCTKTLRKGNTKGCCSSGCESPEAPAYCRAKGVGGKPKQARVKHPDGSDVDAVIARRLQQAGDEVLATGSAARFRAVHDAMGMDVDATLEEFYLGWLDGIRQALES